MTRQRILGLAAFTSLLLFIWGWTPGASGQLPRRQPTPNDTLVSPEVLPTRQVVFRIYAPKASAISVSGDWLGSSGPLKLIRDEQGVWSVTTGPLTPDFYTYAFDVDGVRTLDPKNPIVKPGITSLDDMFFVPGPEAAFEDNRSVPHGEIRQVWYQSSTLSMPRRMHMYMPPGYDRGSARYPVFYLLHGGGDEDAGWSTIGRAGFILDNLLAEKKAKPMIVVMPNGSLPRPAATPGAARDPAAAVAAQDHFTSELLKDIVPFVEKNYRVLAGPQNRALAGLSMGGGQTLRVVTTNSEQFAYVAVWSVGVNADATADFEKRSSAFFGDTAKTNRLIRLFSISVGDQDFTAAGAKNLSEVLRRRGIKHELHISGGGHTWINWRHYLNDYAPLLFR